MRSRRMAWMVGAAMVVALAVGPVGAAPVEVASGGVADHVRGVFTFPGGPPSEVRLTGLRRLGLHVQGLQRLPMALVAGPRADIDRAIANGQARAFHLDQPLELHAVGANSAMRADTVHAAGVTGEGVTVAVVDTGVDATHPDLVGRVTHNVKVVDAGREVGLPPGTAPPLVVAADEGPYSNTDVAGGHGTAVAGMVAGTGVTPVLRGAAPGAEIVGLGTGDSAGLRIAYVLTAWDLILAHPEWGVDIVNNSWGAPGAFAPYDPEAPFTIAAKALHDAGIAVVFSAGNNGTANTPMTMPSWKMSPWVISVGSTNNVGHRSAFSSIGLPHDNTTFTSFINGEAHFADDRVGVYHPTVSAPGENLEAPCNTGLDTVLYGPCTDGYYVGSGTSFSAPNVAGVLALVEQAHPGLTPDELRDVLIGTARPMADGAGLAESGFGQVDAAAAVDLVDRPHPQGPIAAAVGRAERRVLDAREWSVPQSHGWNWQSPLLSVDPVTVDTRELALDVPAGTDAVWLGITFPGQGAGYEYRVVAVDAAGTEVGHTSLASDGLAATAMLDLRGRDVAAGGWRLQVTGTLVAEDDPAGTCIEDRCPEVTLFASLLRAQQHTVTTFESTGELSYAFRALPDRATTPGTSPEGCTIEADTGAEGLLLTTAPGPVCRTAASGYLTTDPGAEPVRHRATFTSEPLAEATVLGGRGRLVATIVEPLRSTTQGLGLIARIFSEIRLVPPLGGPVALLRQESVATVVSGRNTGFFDIAPVTVPAGWRVQISLDVTAPHTVLGRILYDGAYGEDGITLPTGRFVTR